MKDIGTRRAPSRRAGYFWLATTPVIVGAIAIFIVGQAAVAGTVTAVGLGTAGSYGVLGATSITNTGATVIAGNLGLSPDTATSVTGFPPGRLTGSQYVGAAATGAQDDLTTAYNQAAIAPSTGPNTRSTIGSAGLETGPLVPGIYEASSSLEIDGALILDAEGDPNAVWIFQAPASALTADMNSSVVLTGGAQACNVFWLVGGSATIETTATFVGTILALTSITVQNGATIIGRALARNGAVILDDDTIIVPSCATSPTPPPSPTSTPTSTPTTTSSPSPTTTDPTTTPAPSPSSSPSPTSSFTQPAPSPTSSPSPSTNPTPAPVPTPVGTTFPVTG